MLDTSMHCCCCCRNTRHNRPDGQLVNRLNAQCTKLTRSIKVAKTDDGRSMTLQGHLTIEQDGKQERHSEYGLTGLLLVMISLGRSAGRCSTTRKRTSGRNPGTDGSASGDCICRELRSRSRSEVYKSLVTYRGEISYFILDDE